jgi:hypothetical protein
MKRTGRLSQQKRCAKRRSAEKKPWQGFSHIAQNFAFRRAFCDWQNKGRVEAARAPALQHSRGNRTLEDRQTRGLKRRSGMLASGIVSDVGSTGSNLPAKGSE